MELLKPNEMYEGGKYRLEPNHHSTTHSPIWYEIEVLAMFEKEVEFQVLDSNAEHTIDMVVKYQFTHRIFEVRDIFRLGEFRHTKSKERLEERRNNRHKEKEQPRPIHLYEMSNDFRKALIDIALMDNDEEWFKELTGASQVG